MRDSVVFSRLVKITAAVLLIGILSPAALAAKMPEPSYPPLKHEYYPTQNNKFPKEMSNPNAHTRQIAFKGAPLDVFTKINMVTQIVLPSAPALVTVGKPEAYTLEVVPEFNTVFVKPVREVEMTNLIITCENGGVYIFILKENPFVPWDVRVQIKDPVVQAKGSDTQAMAEMLYKGKRLPEYQFIPMDLRSPESSAYVYDPLTRMGCSIVLKRAIALPKSGVSAYWVEFQNILPGDTMMKTSSYSLSEKTVWTPGVIKVAVAGQRNGDSIPMISRGDKVSMFIFVKNPTIPKHFNFRFALMGSKNLPIDVSLPTVSAGAKAAETKLEAKSTVDAKLQKYYDELVEKGIVKPESPSEKTGTIENQAQTQEKPDQTQEKPGDKPAGQQPEQPPVTQPIAPGVITFPES